MSWCAVAVAAAGALSGANTISQGAARRRRETCAGCGAPLGASDVCEYCERTAIETDETARPDGTLHAESSAQRATSVFYEKYAKRNTGRQVPWGAPSPLYRAPSPAPAPVYEYPSYTPPPAPAYEPPSFSSGGGGDFSGGGASGEF